MIASLLKCVSDFPTDVFFVRKWGFWLKIHTVSYWLCWQEFPSLQKESNKISHVCPSICLSDHRLRCIFLNIYSLNFLNFWHEVILPFIVKSDKAEFWKTVLVVLDSWVSETYWTKSGILDILKKPTLFFCFKRFSIISSINLWKRYILENPVF